MGRRLLRWGFGAVGLILALVLAAAVLLDTSPGHRFLVDRILAIRPSSGLRISVDRIDGSLYGRAQIRGLRLYDTRGLFFTAPQITLDWRPSRWLLQRLSIYELASDDATLARLPVLRPGKPGPLLPKYDIYVRRLVVRRLHLGAPLGGGTAQIDAQGEVRRGRAQVRFNAAADKGGDRWDACAEQLAPCGGLAGCVSRDGDGAGAGGCAAADRQGRG